MYPSNSTDVAKKSKKAGAVTRSATGPQHREKRTYVQREQDRKLKRRGGRARQSYRTEKEREGRRERERKKDGATKRVQVGGLSEARTPPHGTKCKSHRNI